MSDTKPFRELHTGEKWEAISGALYDLNRRGQVLVRTSETAAQLAGKASEWAFLTSDMEATHEYANAFPTERTVEAIISELEDWTSDMDRWMDAYIAVLDSMTEVEKATQAFYDAMSGVKQDE